MDSENGKKLEYIHAIVMQEQAFFWQRFEAFSAIHAGLFVLATSTAVTNINISLFGWKLFSVYIAGFLLSLVWMYVQYASLYYVDRLKPAFHKLRADAGIEYRRHWLFSRLPVSSTDAGAFVSVVVAAVWLGLLLVGPHS